MASVDGGQLAHRAPAAAPGRGRAGDGGSGRRRRRCCAAMEAAVQRFVERPELCNEAAAAKVERAGFALTEYLEGVLLGKPASAGGAVPAVPRRAGAGGRRPHPSGRPVGHRMALERAGNAGRRRSRWCTTRRCARAWTRRVLQLVKTGDAAGGPRAGADQPVAGSLADRAPAEDLLEGLRRLFRGRRPRAAAAGRLRQARRLARAAAVRLAGQGRARRVRPAGAGPGVLLRAGGSGAEHATRPASQACARPGAWRAIAPVDYQTAQYGRFDPVLLAQARKRIGAAKDTWSALSGGDAGKLKGLSDQFHLVTRLAAQAAPGQRAAGRRR